MGQWPHQSMELLYNSDFEISSNFVYSGFFYPGEPNKAQCTELIFIFRYESRLQDHDGFTGF